MSAEGLEPSTFRFLGEYAHHYTRADHCQPWHNAKPVQVQIPPLPHYYLIIDIQLTGVQAPKQPTNIQSHTTQ